jgi:uncharacterized protein (TIGR03437 family)
MKVLQAAAAALWLTSLSVASEPDALAIDANIQARHIPFGTVLDPIYASPTSNQIVAYTRCGDSALWTGAYLAAESFRYHVTQSPAALLNVKAALAGLKGLADVTGDNRLARCMFPADSPFAPGIVNEETSHTIHQNPPWIWVDDTSRDQLVGAFFGLNIAFDLVDDPAIKTGARDLVTRLIGFVSRHQWSPNDDISNTFLLRPEELQMMLQVARHVDPSSTISGPLLVPPVSTGIEVDILSNSSYFKFNLDYMSLYHLLSLQNSGDNRGAYLTLRNYTANHQNPFFNLIDRALRGPDPARDAETPTLLEQWLERPRRDFFVDLSGKVAVCGGAACLPVPVPLRPPASFLWEVTPFQLQGGGSGIVENAGVDYLLAYWMARDSGVISGSGVQSAAAPGIGVAPASLGSLYGANLAASTAQATSQPLPLTLGGITLTVTDSAGAQHPAPLLYVSPTQVNFLLPDNTAAGPATFTVAGQNAASVVQPIAPALFSMSGTGSGVAAALAVAVRAGNPEIQFPIPVFQCGSQGCLAVPIDVGLDRPVFLSLYGTGIRNRSSLANVTVTINGIAIPPQYAGPAPGFSGLDQVNVPLLLSLRGAGAVNVSVTVDGQTSNQVAIDIQ